VVFSQQHFTTSAVGLYLGRATDGDPDTMATMDILDLGWSAYKTPKKMWMLLNALDSIYGVTNS
jgi:hypothetical protein